MIKLNLSASGDEKLQQFLRLLAGAPEAPAMRNRIGFDVSELLRTHLYRKDAEPNKLGGKKTHYYRAAGDSVNHDSTGSIVGVNVTQIGIRQRLEGGVITPKTAKALTIPISPRAHGKRAREFQDTFVIDKFAAEDPDTIGMIVQAIGPDKIDPLYILKKRVKQDPDPTVLPERSVIVRTATSAVAEFLNQLEGRN